LYDDCVASISLYGSEVIGYQKYDTQFKLYVRAARSFLGLPKSVASYGLVSELDWLLPHYSGNLKMIQFLGRIFKFTKNRLLVKVYNWDKNLNESGRIFTWTSEVKEILQSHDLLSIYEKEQIFPIKNTIKMLKESMEKAQKELVKYECERKPKLRTFLTFKQFGSLPPHVGKPLSFLERKMISKLRLGILPLRMETARYERPIIPENERLCYCQSGAIESEYHVLIECSVYDDLRDIWMNSMTLPENFCNLCSGGKLNEVLNVAVNLRHTAKYLLSVMDRRQMRNKLY